MSDGTEVDLGGEVRGTSEFAAELRESFLGRFAPATVGIYPEPGGHRTLDVNDPTMMDRFLFQRGQWRGPNRPKIDVVRKPEFEPRNFPPRPDNTPPGAVN